MRCFQRLVVFLISPVVLFASFVLAQKQEEKSQSCKNQSEVEFIGFEIVSGAVESVNVETETLVPEGDFLFTNKGKPILFATYKYDRRGRLIEKNFYRTDGVATPKTTFDYDSENNLIKENHFSAVTQKPYLETKYVYESGLLKEIVGLSLDDNDILSKKIFSYDSKKRYFEFVESKSYRKEEFRIGFNQDDKCRFSEIILYQPDGNVAGKNVFSFDDKNNPVLITYYSSENSILGKRKFEYEFDSHGNWVKQSHYSWEKENNKFDWKLMKIEYRKIRYFDTK